MGSRQPLLIIILLGLIARHARGRWITKNIELPKSTLIESYGDLEIRELPSSLVATVTVNADQMSSAGSNGFRPLAGFIFGDNISSESIKMTAPVTTKAVSQKIEMTAPVTTTQKENNLYDVSFVMPSKWTKDTLPVPNNKNVVIAETAPKKVAVWTFGGYATAGKIEKQRAKFLDSLEKNKISRTGEFTLAQYNDPRTPPQMRTNEWWVEVK